MSTVFQSIRGLFSKCAVRLAVLAFLLATGSRPALAGTEVTIAGQPYTLTAHPRVLFDGPAGTMTARIKDPDGAGPRVAPQADDANPAFVALKKQIRACAAAPPSCGLESTALSALLAALDWYMDNSQSRSLAAAKLWLSQVEQEIAVHRGGCNAAGAECTADSSLDRAAFDLAYYALAYTLIVDQLTETERVAFARKMLNGAGSAPHVDCGEHRAPDAEPCGYVRMLQHHSYNPQGRSIGFAKTTLTRAVKAGDTTVSVSDASLLPSELPYLLSLNGTEMVEVTSAEGSVLSVKRAQLGTAASAVISGKPVYYTRVLPNVGTTDYANGAVVRRLLGYAFIGNALADDREVARELLDAAVDDWLTHVVPKNKDMWTGFTQGGSSEFGSLGQLTPNAALTAMLMRVDGTPALDQSAGEWLKLAVPAYLYATLPPAEGTFVPWGQPDAAVSPSFASHQWAPILSGIYGPANEATRFWNHWQRDVTRQYTAENLARIANAPLLPFALMYAQESDPRADYKAAYPPQRAFTRVDGTASYALTAWISRTSWESADDTLVFNQSFPSGWSRDHLGAGAPGAYKIYKRGWLLTENGPHDTGEGVDTNMPIFGDAASLTPFGVVTVTHVSSDDSGAYAYVQINSQAACHARANVTRVLRSIFHLKKPGTQDYVVVYDSLESWAGAKKTIHLYFDKSPDEASAMSSSRLPSLVWTGPARRLSTTVVLPHGDEVVAVSDETPNAYRVALCVSADGHSCDTENSVAAFMVVHRPSTDAADAMPPVGLLQTITENFVAVQIEGADPKVVALPAAGVPRAGIEFTTTHAGVAQVVVAGMEAGVYDVKRNGETVCAEIEVDPASGIAACELDSGAIEVVRASRASARPEK